MLVLKHAHTLSPNDAHMPTRAGRELGKHMHGARSAINMVLSFFNLQFKCNTGSNLDFASLFPKYSRLVMPESCSAGELEHRPEELCWCACLMQASPGILPVYCFSTSGVYHTHMYTPTHAEPERVGGWGCVCKRVSIHYVCVCEKAREKERDCALWCVTDLCQHAQTCLTQPWPACQKSQICSSHPTTLCPMSSHNAHCRKRQQ